MITLTSRQTIGRDGHRFLGLSGSIIPSVFPEIILSLSKRASKYKGLTAYEKGVISPYFQMADLREEAPDRDIKLSLSYMDFLIDGWGASGGNPYLIVSWWDSSNVFQNSSVVFMTFSAVRSNGLAAAATAAINAYATANSLTVASINGLLDAPLTGSPKAAIADAAGGALTNLATNYNLATGILGLATALNTANAAQNDLGTKFNSLVATINTLLAELRSLNLIST